MTCALTAVGTWRDSRFRRSSTSATACRKPRSARSRSGHCARRSLAPSRHRARRRADMAVSMAEVYANTSKLVGVVHSRQLGRIERRDLERFSAATGADVATSGAAGPEPVVAHPLYLTAVLGWGGGPANEELRPDGTEVLDIDAIPLSGLR